MIAGESEETIYIPIFLLLCIRRLDAALSLRGGNPYENLSTVDLPKAKVAKAAEERPRLAKMTIIHACRNRQISTSLTKSIRQKFITEVRSLTWQTL